jgi:hypothetical protein
MYYLYKKLPSGKLFLPNANSLVLVPDENILKAVEMPHGATLLEGYESYEDALLAAKRLKELSKAMGLKDFTSIMAVEMDGPLYFTTYSLTERKKKL